MAKGQMRSNKEKKKPKADKDKPKQMSGLRRASPEVAAIAAATTLRISSRLSGNAGWSGPPRRSGSACAPW